MKYIAAGISFILIWFLVAVLIGIVMAFIFKPDSRTMVGIGFNWMNLPGTVIGFFAGLHSARSSIRIANKRSRDKDNNKSSG